MADDKPNATSSDYDAMCPFWDMVATILDGADAMRAAGEKYLPKFPNETQDDYDYRRKNAKFTNIYRDIVESLAAKPFSSEVTVADDASDRIKELVEDIDAQGNHLHVFSAGLFFQAINDGIDWILVDFTKGVPRGQSVAAERAIGARPYWVHVPAKRLLAIYSDMVDGTEQFVHARILEPETVRSGFGEATVNRVRVLNREKIEGGGYAPATYEVWEERKAEGTQPGTQWVSIEGPLPITIGVIPLVPLLIGRRKEGSWQVIPPMKDAAFLQIEHYQQETALKSIKELTAFPMLAGNGIAPPTNEQGKPAIVPVGPRSVLFAPPNGDGEHGEWTFIEPNASALEFLAKDIQETAKELRELGRQPLTAQSGNLTVVTTQFAAQKGNSAIQAWALNLKDCLENALALTAQWLLEDSAPEVSIDADFDLDIGEDDTFQHVLSMRDKGELSQGTLWEEAKRRKILGPEFDADKEETALNEEMPEGDTEDDVTAAVVPAPNAKTTPLRQ